MSEVGMPARMEISTIAKFVVPVIVGAVVWALPVPEGLEPRAMQMLAIFLATIMGIILAPMPMSAVAIVGGSIASLLGVIEFNDFAASNGTGLVWLVVMAFFISKGIIKTGLGRRVALFFLWVLGKRTLGLGYGLVLTELVLAPAMPSVTARAGGVMLPITRAISEVLESYPDPETRGRVGSYLIQCAFQCNIMTAAMFVTAMAGNPLAVQLAGDQGVEITWLGWAVAAFVPGVVCLALIPLVLMVINRPQVTETPDAAAVARKQLQEMGRVSGREMMMALIFLGLIVLWVFGQQLGIGAPLTATLGVSVMLLVGIITWQDALEEKNAWDTMVWIGILIMMAGMLNTLGMIGWFSGEMEVMLQGFSTTMAYVLVVGIYFYSHYFFASATAHIGALYAASLAILIASGVNPFTAAITLACMSNVFGCLTQYAIGSAPVLFGAGYLTQAEWLRTGFIMSVIYLLVWMTVGPLWWGIIG